MIEGGTSTVIAIGTPPGEAGWTVRVRKPYNDIKGYIDEVKIHDESLSTSAAYDKAPPPGAPKRSHIFDPRTGQPVDGMLSVSAIAPTGTLSDALSTAFFVMGKEKVEAYCRAHPEVRAIVVVSEDGAPKAIRINFPLQKERS
jgi:thiamine biosynthesis lipoprotein